MGMIPKLRGISSRQKQDTAPKAKTYAPMGPCLSWAATVHLFSVDALTTVALRQSIAGRNTNTDMPLRSLLREVYRPSAATVHIDTVVIDERKE